ncbi:MAG TPA: M48 family metallopeptidase [Noviherbaspirillum sp.]|nr:M48 family metallopeptidase [Noviherbaspirillum sp.]
MSRTRISSPAVPPHRARATRCLALIPIMLLASCALPPSRPAPPHPAAPTAPPVAQQAQVPSTPPAAAAPAITPAAPQPAEQPPALPDKGLALRNWVGQQSRIYRVAAPLLINNTELCPQHARPILGFTAKNRYSYSSEFSDAAQAALGLGEELRVMDVLPGSGAEQAGMRKGDVLLAVEIEPAPEGPDAEHVAAALIGEEMQGRDSLHLQLRRDGEHISVDVPLTQACAMVLDLGNTDDVRSFSDGRRVMVTRGMLDFVQNDTELAYVLAGEIARNAVMPDERPDMRALIDRLHTVDANEASGASGGLSATPATSPPGTEATVDRLALYMLARAGYDIDGIAPFETRLAAHGEGGTVHSLASADLAAQQQTIRELKMKREDGLPLLP